jgi:hypothetical protein
MHRAIIRFMNNNKIIVIVAAIAISLGVWLKSDRTTIEENEGVPSPTISANAPSETNASQPLGSISPITPSSLLPNLDPFATIALNDRLVRSFSNEVSLQTLRELRRNRSLAEAQVEAAMSDDPLVHATSIFMMFPCMSEAVMLASTSARHHFAKFALDPKTGKPRPVSDDEIAFAELRASGGPQRIYPPEGVREKLRKEMEEPWEARMARLDRGERDYPAEMQLWREMRAPLDAEGRAAFEGMRDALSKACLGQTITKEFGPAFRATRERLAAQGVISALIFNEQAGWTSRRSLKELSDRDYELVARGIHEQHADVLAMLLLRSSLTVSLGLLDLPKDADVATFGLGFEIPRLAACQLSVADCSRDGYIFQETCLNYGGCDASDVAALWRAVLESDGLNPNALEHAVADLVAKIRRGDLDALGIRRKPKP